MTHEEIRQAKEDLWNELDSIGYYLEDREVPELDRAMQVRRKAQIKIELQNLKMIENNGK